MWKKIVFKIRNWITRLLVYKKYKLSEQGKCFVRYIIDKYINQIKSDDYSIERYEEIITNREQRIMNQMPFVFEEEDDPFQKRAFISMVLLGLMLAPLPLAESMELLAQIKRPDYKNFILGLRKRII